MVMTRWIKIEVHFEHQMRWSTWPLFCGKELNKDKNCSERNCPCCVEDKCTRIHSDR